MNKNLSDYFETNKVFFDLNLQKVIKTWEFEKINF